MRAFRAIWDIKDATTAAVALAGAITWAIRAMSVEVASWALWLQIPFLVFSALFLFISIRWIWRGTRSLFGPGVQRLRHKIGGEWAEQQDDRGAARTQVLPQMIQTSLRNVQVTGLWELEPFLRFELVVRNVSGMPVAIKGIKGKVRALGKEILLPPQLENERPLSLDSTTWSNCPIKQPLASQIAELARHELFPMDGDLFLGLDGIRWECETPDGGSFEAYLELDTFTVRGPMRDHDAESKKIQKFRTAFGSQPFWQADGRPKPEATP